MKAAKRKYIRLFILLVTLLSLVGGYVFWPAAISVKQQDMGDAYPAGPYNVQLQLSPEKPKIGNNQITIVIHDQDNQPVSDATIQAYAEMPAMGSMQAMREAVSIENAGAGVYQGRFTLPMNGIWPLTVIIESNVYGKAELSFAMGTSRTGLQLTSAIPGDRVLQKQQESMPESSQPAAFNVDNFRRQLIGVTTGKVRNMKMLKTIHAGARITYDQTRLTDISLKYDGWIGKLQADFVGKKMQQGQILFDVYSQELVSAQEEYLDSIRRSDSARYSLRSAARRRLALWDIDAAQIKAIQQRGRAREYLPILAPASATVIEKNIVAGSAVKAGERLLRLADLSSVWVEGEVYESELPWLKTGMDARVTLPDLPGLSYAAKIKFIEPVLQTATRTAVIRAELPNPNGLLRPDMYARLDLQIDLGERLLIPEQAVIYSGEQRIVFVDKGNGRLQPKKIISGLRNEDYIEVLNGLSAGDVIVTSGNFLLAAESKLKAGLAQW
jgi:membrane fusion protein, copper/silver efflux system